MFAVTHELRQNAGLSARRQTVALALMSMRTGVAPTLNTTKVIEKRYIHTAVIIFEQTNTCETTHKSLNAQIEQTATTTTTTKRHPSRNCCTPQRARRRARDRRLVRGHAVGVVAASGASESVCGYGARASRRCASAVTRHAAARLAERIPSHVQRGRVRPVAMQL